MSRGALYAKSFVVVGIIGWIVESLRGSEWHSDSPPGGYRNPFPFALAWGLAGMLLLSLRLLLPNTNRLLLSVFAAIVMSSFECVIGNLALMVGMKVEDLWNYTGMTTCKGFVSAQITAYWVAGSFLYYTLIDHVIEKEKI